MHRILLPILALLTTGCACEHGIGITGQHDGEDEEAHDPAVDVADILAEDPAPRCGDGVLDEGEQCDGDDLGGATCESLGHDGGALACDPVCTYDESLCGDLPDCVRYVDIDTTAVSPDGLSWATAVADVQQGIDFAAEVAGEVAPCEVWVTEGTYYIFRIDQQDTVRLRPFVHVYGGFDGTETLRLQRDWEEHETILSGRAEERDDTRVCHVVTASDFATLDGFTVTKGRAGDDYFRCDPASPGSNSAGGMIVVDSSPTVSNCVFRENTAGYRLSGGGGAMLVTGESDPVIEDCSFIDNDSDWSGGAILVTENSSLTIVGGLFEGNQNSISRGGAIGYAGEALLAISGCTFRENQHSAVAVGPVGTALIENCVFDGNASAGYGGAIVVNSAELTLANCTFHGNSSGEEGIIQLSRSEADPSLVATNLVMWGNSGVPISAFAGMVTVGWSDIEGGFFGEDNIDADPLFVDAVAGDFRLQAGSPCIDAADGDAAPSADIVGNPRVDDTSVLDTGTGTPSYADMGAYEFLP